MKITSEQAGRKREGEQSAEGRTVVPGPVVLHGIPTLRETVLFMAPVALDCVPEYPAERADSRRRSKCQALLRNRGMGYPDSGQCESTCLCSGISCRGRREMYVVTGGETKGRLRPITGRGLFLFRGRLLSGNKRPLLPVRIIGKYEKDNMESMTWKTQHGKYDMENTTWKVWKGVRYVQTGFSRRKPGRT